MINQQRLKIIEFWFENYVQRFKSPDKKYKKNIKLKKDHTYRVCDEIIRIGKNLNLNNQDLNLAKTIALLHDVGRFEQYDRYRTFADYKSENHAELSISILIKEGILEGIDNSTKRIVDFAITHHNNAHLPQQKSDRSLFFAKLIRDADKLDVLYVVTEHYHNKDKEHNDVIEFGLLDPPQISDKVFKNLISGSTVEFKHIQNLNDLKLLQMAWIYDINFPITFHLIKERQYLEKIWEVLPDSDKAQKAYKAVRSYLDLNCTRYKRFQSA